VIDFFTFSALWSRHTIDAKQDSLGARGKAILSVWGFACVWG
jgi:hypothetical protein